MDSPILRSRHTDKVIIQPLINICNHFGSIYSSLNKDIRIETNDYERFDIYCRQTLYRGDFNDLIISINFHGKFIFVNNISTGEDHTYDFTIKTFAPIFSMKKKLKDIIDTGNQITRSNSNSPPKTP